MFPRALHTSLECGARSYLTELRQLGVNDFTKSRDNILFISGDSKPRGTGIVVTSLLTQRTKTITQKYTPKINISSFVPASQLSSGRAVKCCHFLPIRTTVQTVTRDSGPIPHGVEVSALPLSQYDVCNSTNIHGKG